MIKIISIFGTRPEAIKMAPVVRELAKYPDRIISRVCVTAQHREMLDQVLDLFEITPDYDLDVMQDNQTPTQVASIVLSQLEPILRREKPDWVLVQGDTTSAMAVAIAAFYAGVKVGHVEAGLRTFDKWQPFPEEMNRHIVGVIADKHFAPTERSRQNLLREGVPNGNILVTGNPVIDALHWAATKPFDFNSLNLPVLNSKPSNIKLILVTAHRRENIGRPIENICRALEAIAKRYGDTVVIVYPVHLNPNVQEPVNRLLSGVPNIILLPPLDYLSLVHLMKCAYLVLTDSGGIQEEAPGFGKPVLVLRDVTERPEAVEAGTVKLVGTDIDTIINTTIRLLEDTSAYKKMATAINPYGDGHAAIRISSALRGEIVLPFQSIY